ncbi:MAG: oligosaccharide flippase family protein [Burkholderiaceae bacterium]
MLSRAYGADLLGAFNQILSIYIVGAQVASGGSHLATIRMLPLYPEDVQRQWATVAAAIVIAAALSLAVVGATLAGAPLLTSMFDSPLVALGLAPLTLALAFSGINKVMLGALNATERHGAFAFLQGLRPLVVLLGVLWMWRFAIPGDWVFLLVPLAELLVLVASLALVLPMARRAGWHAAWRNELPAVWSFARRVFPGGLIAEANSRVDVLVLGVLGSDHAVGIYSFASMYAEGLAQLPSVIRNAVSARLVRMSGDSTSLWRAMPGLMRFGYAFLVPAFVVAALAYWLIAHWSLPPVEQEQALAVFAIVLICLILAAGALPLDMLLSQLGYPGWMSALRGTLFLVNLAGCIALYQAFGVYGVALSVGAGYIAFPLGTLLIARRLTRAAGGLPVQ